MGFCVRLSQVEKTRSIAERALETISVEREAERLNVWTAYVNLEAEFGNMNDIDTHINDSMGMKRSAAIMCVFHRGCQRVNNVESFDLLVANALGKASTSAISISLGRHSDAYLALAP